MSEVTGGMFPTGRLVMTAHLQQVLKESDPEGWQNDLNRMVARHVTGDWGELPEEDIAANNEAVIHGSRSASGGSAYTSSTGIKVWIITEWDRSVTTCLLPEDY